VQAKDDDARVIAGREPAHVREIEIEGDEDTDSAAVCAAITASLAPAIPSCRQVVASCPPAERSASKSSGMFSSILKRRAMWLGRQWEDLFPGEHGGIFQGGLDILVPLTGVVPKEFRLAGPRREVVQDHGNEDPGPFDARFAVAGVRIMDDAVQMAHESTLLGRDCDLRGILANRGGQVPGQGPPLDAGRGP
jgi:hypothetical protein